MRTARTALETLVYDITPSSMEGSLIGAARLTDF
jgi:hypothetical protein